MVEGSVVLVLGAVFYALAWRHDFLEAMYEFSRRHEDRQIDELFATGVFLALLLLIYSVRRGLDLYHHSQCLEQKNQELSRALAEVHHLRGLLPICAGCKKVRDDQGYWQEVDQYLAKLHDVRITHGLCPACFENYYPGLLPQEVVQAQPDRATPPVDPRRS
ncbi:MAG: hypothetical protein V1797_06405 [Pseudomonadota bacterium]